MKHTVLSGFPWSPDGCRTEHLVPGDIRAFQPSIVAGLLAAGLIGDADQAHPAPDIQSATIDDDPADADAGFGGGIDPVVGADGLIEIPAGWETMRYPQMRALAAKISPGHAIGAESCKAIIRSYIGKKSPAATSPAG